MLKFGPKMDQKFDDFDDFGGQNQGPDLDGFWRPHSGQICPKRSFWRSKMGPILGRKVGQKYVIFGNFWRVLYGGGSGFGDLVQACWHGVARWRRGVAIRDDRNLIEISWILDFVDLVQTSKKVIMAVLGPSFILI